MNCSTSRSSSPCLMAEVVVETWRSEYNNHRAHSSSGGMNPAKYAKAWIINQSALP